MRYVELGAQGLIVSALGVGCMGMTATYGPADEQGNLATLARALDLGVTFFDTAEVYGPYLNEELLGNCFAGIRSKLVLATKVGFSFTTKGQLQIIDGKPVVYGDPAQIRTAVEGSLRRLRTDQLISSTFIVSIPSHPSKTQSERCPDSCQQADPIHRGLRSVSLSDPQGPTPFIRSPPSRLNIRCSSAALSRIDVLSTTRELRIGFVHYSR